MKKIYLISGLGADERAFQHLDLRAYDVIYIAWIEALKKETLAHYAGRLLAQVSTKKPILIGLSFGGMIAIEMAKQIETEKVVLISSVKTKKELPPGFKLAGFLGIHKIIPHHCLHIHGTRDRVFSIKYIQADFKVEKGGHFMILNRADEISRLVKSILQ